LHPYAALFTCEAAAKLYAFGPSMYWSDGWNRFDLAVVIASDIGIVLTAGSLLGRSAPWHAF
jgi:hypothetical protein